MSDLLKWADPAGMSETEPTSERYEAFRRKYGYRAMSERQTGATDAQIAAAAESLHAASTGCLAGPGDECKECLSQISEGSRYLVPPDHRIVPLDLLRRVSDCLDGQFLTDEWRELAQEFRDAVGLP